MTETIKLALEKAKRGQPPGEGRPHDAFAPFGAAPPRQKPPVSYSETAVVALDERHLSRHRIVALDKGDRGSAVIDLLRTHVLRKMDEHGWRTLAVTSPTPRTGKTVVAINLAISIARQADRSSLLVDFDLRNPSVAPYLGIPVDGRPTLNDVFAGRAQVARALVNPGIPRFVCLPAASPEEGPAEMLGSGYVAAMVHAFRDRYDERVVVFDLPPLPTPDDAMAILPSIDGVLVVVGEGRAKKADIETCFRLIPPDRVLGVVLNAV